MSDEMAHGSGKTFMAIYDAIGRGHLVDVTDIYRIAADLAREGIDIEHLPVNKAAALVLTRLQHEHGDLLN